MIDQQKKKGTDLSDTDRNNLLNRIDELETLLAKKKQEAQKQSTPRLKVGTDGIPVLSELFDETAKSEEETSIHQEQDKQLIDDIIHKVDKEISEDLDELILMLKDSIIDEVKTRLIKEFQLDQKNNN